MKKDDREYIPNPNLEGGFMENPNFEGTAFEMKYRSDTRYPCTVITELNGIKKYMKCKGMTVERWGRDRLYIMDEEGRICFSGGAVEGVHFVLK